MHKQFREKDTRSLYMPIELIELIQKRADMTFSSFNKIVVEVFLKEFFFSKNKSDEMTKSVNRLLEDKKD